MFGATIVQYMVLEYQVLYIDVLQG